MERALKLCLVPRKRSSEAKVTMPMEESLADVTSFSFLRSKDSLAFAMFCFVYFFPFSVQISLYCPVALLAGCGLVVPPVFITECPSMP